MNAGHHRRKETPRTFGEKGTMVSYNMYFIIILYITNVMNQQIQVGDENPLGSSRIEFNTRYGRKYTFSCIGMSAHY